MAQQLNTLENFASKINFTMLGCWEWNGKPDNKGYGRFCMNYRKMTAPRFSYEIFNKVILTDEDNVLHTCHNRLCVNPRHLYLGTSKQNTMDMMIAGRHPKTKLTPEKVKDIRKLLQVNTNMSEIGRRFSVSPTTIRQIKKHKSWTWI